MPRFIVPPKYIYSQESGRLFLPTPTSVASSKKWEDNGMIPWFSIASNVMNSTIIAPAPVLPVIGNGHDCRSHSKITVTTIRWKLSLELKLEAVTSGTVFNNLSSASTFTKFPVTTAQYPPNPNQFYKFRYMMVEFDEDLAITPRAIMNWFLQTYCFYRQPTVTPEYPLPTENIPSETDLIPGPVSVHSNVMRITTPWVGKFKILADKCFEITSNRPRVNIDLTVPINRVYTWNDEMVSFDQSSDLIRPHIYCFVLPPLSYEQDFSIWDRKQAEQLITISQIQTYQGDFVNWQSWMKLNFVDI